MAIPDPRRSVDPEAELFDVHDPQLRGLEVEDVGQDG